MGLAFIISLLSCSWSANCAFVAPSCCRQLLSRLLESRSGIAYVSGNPDDTPVVKLFTRNGCTTCDKVMENLRSVAEESPHTLELVDIEDPEHLSWFERYKYDLPILRLNDMYWTCSRLTTNEAKAGIFAATAGFFVQGRNEPNAKQMELQMMQPPSTPNLWVGDEEGQGKLNPRRASSGNFQKMLVKGIRDRHMGECELDT